MHHASPAKIMHNGKLSSLWNWVQIQEWYSPKSVYLLIMRRNLATGCKMTWCPLSHWLILVDATTNVTTWDIDVHEKDDDPYSRSCTAQMLFDEDEGKYSNQFFKTFVDACPPNQEYRNIHQMWYYYKTRNFFLGQPSLKKWKSLGSAQPTLQQTIALWLR